MVFQVKPVQAIVAAVLALLVGLSSVLWLRGKALATERDRARLEAATAAENLRRLEASVKETNEALDQLAKQGRELTSQVATASARAEVLQREGARRVEALLAAQVPGDASGALAWAHQAVGSAAAEFHQEGRR